MIVDCHVDVVSAVHQMQHRAERPLERGTLGRGLIVPLQRTALADSIPQWVLFKMPTVEPTPPINDPLTNAVQRSVHNRPVTDYRPYRLLSRIRHLGATE